MFDEWRNYTARKHYQLDIRAYGPCSRLPSYGILRLNIHFDRNTFVVY